MKDNNERSEREKHADSIIKNHMIWSMGAGFIPVPIVDFFAVGAIQLDMVRQLCKLYEVDFKETEGKAVISALTGSGLARLGARAVKFIPGIGSVMGGVTMAILSGGSSYALGEVFKKHFETGGTFLDFDPARLKKYYNEKFEKGKVYAQTIRDEQEMKTKVADETIKREEIKKEVVQEVKKEEPANDVVSQLERLAQLRSDEIISDEEFDIMKKKILES